MKERDYSDLEGKVVKFICSHGTFQALVAGCDFDLGITLVNAENHDHYFWCLLGDSAPVWRKGRTKPKPEDDHYLALFYSGVHMIKKGKVEANRIQKIQPSFWYSTGPSAEICPFT